MPISRPLLILAMLAVAFSGTLLWAWPKYQEFMALRAQLEQKEAELENRDQYLAHLQDVKGQLERREEALSRIDAAIPAEPSLPLLYDGVQSLTAESGMVLNTIASSILNVGSIRGGAEESDSRSPQELLEQEETSQEREPDIQRKRITLSLTVSGSYANLKTFVGNVLSASRFFEITGIRFEGGEGDSFRFNIDLQTYSY